MEPITIPDEFPLTDVPFDTKLAPLSTYGVKKTLRESQLNDKSSYLFQKKTVEIASNLSKPLNSTPSTNIWTPSRKRREDGESSTNWEERHTETPLQMLRAKLNGESISEKSVSTSSLSVKPQTGDDSNGLSVRINSIKAVSANSISPSRVETPLQQVPAPSIFERIGVEPDYQDPTPIAVVEGFNPETERDVNMYFAKKMHAIDKKTLEQIEVLGQVRKDLLKAKVDLEEREGKIYEQAVKTYGAKLDLVDVPLEKPLLKVDNHVLKSVGVIAIPEQHEVEALKAHDVKTAKQLEASLDVWSKHLHIPEFQRTENSHPSTWREPMKLLKNVSAESFLEVDYKDGLAELKAKQKGRVVEKPRILDPVLEDLVKKESESLNKPALPDRKFKNMTSFQIKPLSILFDGFVPGATSTSKLHVTNTTQTTLRIRLAPKAQIPAFKIVNKANISEIAPGMTVVFNIDFMPKTYEEFEWGFFVESGLGEKLYIPVLAQREAPKIKVVPVDPETARSSSKKTPVDKNAAEFVNNSILFDFGICRSEAPTIEREFDVFNLGGDLSYYLLGETFEDLEHISPLVADNTERSSKEKSRVGVKSPFEDEIQFLYKSESMLEESKQSCLNIGAFEIFPKLWTLPSNSCQRVKVRYTPALDSLEQLEKVNGIYQKLDSHKIKVAVNNCNITEISLTGLTQKPKATVQRVIWENKRISTKESDPELFNVADSLADFVLNMGEQNFTGEVSVAVTIQNNTELRLPFQWQTYDNRGETFMDSTFYEHENADTYESFSITPASGNFAPLESTTFTFTFHPQDIKKYDIFCDLIFTEMHRQNTKFSYRIRALADCVPFEVTTFPPFVDIPRSVFVGETYETILRVSNQSMIPLNYKVELSGIDERLVDVAVVWPEGVLPASSSLPLTVRITAYYPGKINGNIKLVTGTRGVEPVVNVPLSAVIEARGGMVMFDKDYVDFGLVQLGHHASVKIPLVNKSSFAIPYKLRYHVRPQPGDQNDIKQSDRTTKIVLKPSEGILDPYQKITVTATFIPLWYQRFRGVLECCLVDETEAGGILDYASMSNIELRGEVLTPKVCLAQPVLDFPQIYYGVPTTAKLTIRNLTMLEAKFKWVNFHRGKTAVTFQPNVGVLKGLEEKEIEVELTSREIGGFQNLNCFCSIEDMVEGEGKVPLVINGTVFGLKFSFEMLETQEHKDWGMRPESSPIHLAADRKLGSTDVSLGVALSTVSLKPTEVNQDTQQEQQAQQRSSSRLQSRPQTQSEQQQQRSLQIPQKNEKPVLKETVVARKPTAKVIEFTGRLDIAGKNKKLETLLDIAGEVVQEPSPAASPETSQTQEQLSAPVTPDPGASMSAKSGGKSSLLSRRNSKPVIPKQTEVSLVNIVETEEKEKEKVKAVPSIPLDFGNDCSIFSTRTRVIKIQNHTEIPTRFTVSFQNYPTAVSQIDATELLDDEFFDELVQNSKNQESRTSTRASKSLLLPASKAPKLGFTTEEGNRYLNQVQTLRSTVKKMSNWLSTGNGCAFHANPSQGVLEPLETLYLKVSSLNNAIGTFEDIMTISMEGWGEEKIPVRLGVKGVPVIFQALSLARSENPDNADRLAFGIGMVVPIADPDGLRIEYVKDELLKSLSTYKPTTPNAPQLTNKSVNFDASVDFGASASTPPRPQSSLAQTQPQTQQILSRPQSAISRPTSSLSRAQTAASRPQSAKRPALRPMSARVLSQPIHEEQPSRPASPMRQSNTAVLNPADQVKFTDTPLPSYVLNQLNVVKCVQVENQSPKPVVLSWIQFVRPALQHVGGFAFKDIIKTYYKVNNSEDSPFKIEPSVLRIEPYQSASLTISFRSHKVGTFDAALLSEIAHEEVTGAGDIALTYPIAKQPVSVPVSVEMIEDIKSRLGSFAKLHLHAVAINPWLTVGEVKIKCSLDEDDIWQGERLVGFRNNSGATLYYKFEIEGSGFTAKPEGESLNGWYLAKASEETYITVRYEQEFYRKTRLGEDNIPFGEKIGGATISFKYLNGRIQEVPIIAQATKITVPDLH